LALTADTGNYEVYFYLGRSLQQVGAYPSAQKRFYQALTKAGEPANFHGHVLEHVSENYMLQSEYEKSIHFADSALALDSTVYDAYLWIGQSAYALTDFEKGAKAMERFTAQNQESTLAYSILGNCYYEQQRYSSAIRAYNSALQIDSVLAEVLSYKAKSHALLRQFQLSFNAFEALSKLHKGNFYAINGMGVCAYFLGDYETALGYYIEANNLHQNMWFKYNLGLCYQQLEQYDNAIAMYNQVDAMQKWIPEVIVKKTECLLAAKKYDKLMQYTDEVIDIGAKFPFIRDIYLARAEAFKAQGNTERYEKNLRVANYVKGKMEINTNPRIE
jgi:tetratricopeptide (TPR) repeat protein